MSLAHQPFSQREQERIEASTLEIGRFIFQRASERAPRPTERRWWDDRIMGWAMQDEALKLQMFRFVDVLPMLADSTAVTRHLHEYLDSERLPGAIKLGLNIAAPRSLAGRALALAARRNVQSYARRFIAGSNTTEVLAAAMRERKLRRAFTLDILGEAVTSDREAERYFNMYLELLDQLAPRANAWPEVPQIDRGAFEELPRLNLSVKLSALDSQFDPIDPEGTTRRVAERLRHLLRAARSRRAFIHVDMESYHIKDLTLAIFQHVLGEPEFRDFADVGIVIQGYLRDSGDDLVRLRDWAAQRGTPVWVRLVKGAYWDYETVHAAAMGWPVPVFQQKWETDANYERLTVFLMQNYQILRPALGSHNIRSLAHGLAVARHLGVPSSAFELQMLYGMGDQEKQALVDLGYRLRIYMPYGQLLPGMAYLVRRLLENTSNESFLKAGFSDHVSPEVLLMNPKEHDPGRQPAAKPLTPGPSPTRGEGRKQDRPAFQNEPWTDFALGTSRRAMQTALAEVREQLGRHYPLVIGGRQVDTRDRLASLNPSHKNQVVGTVASASPADVEAAVAAARQALPAWSGASVDERATWLERAADALAERRFELAAWEVYECGKGWREADADVTEAIDFCRYYALHARQLQSPVEDVPGEDNQLEYLPRGVVGVIAPWNFPLAILTGMTTAALATGNTVVMKPAEQSPVIAAKLAEVFEAVGLPPGVLNLVSGTGEAAGAALVEHPDTAVIAFTGSRAVGLAINARAAEVSARPIGYVKRVIAEMGGKNAIIVDDDADLDEAVLGVVRSAFGYQGQKCSACSRAIVLATVYDTFLERLVESARSLKVGPAEDPSTSVGPVIDAESLARVRQYIDIGRREGREVLAVDVGPLANEGYYVGPHIFADVAPDSRLAQEEIFGPVLAVIRARDLDDAFRIANGTQYALTGGLFSRSPANLQRARRELLVGNLYLNRGITGAMVGRQPFGGFKLSGIGSKAGGADYLLQFVLPRVVTENTMRRGFAPMEPTTETEAAE
jgi:RHH-type proline utilization regulon transcriptional repressor/proline dehydrogenase/delta 1-pyrroline-5-carboxylate dehydrogenase